MKTCQYAGQPLSPPRSHPWTTSAGNEASRYYDFKAHPHLIRTVLEDFVPWSHYPAVTRLYTLLEHLNSPASDLESNDCVFSAPQPTETPDFGKQLQAEGRVMLLFRELAKNGIKCNLEDLAQRVHMQLATHDRDFEWGLLGTDIPPVRYLALPVPHEQQFGYQLTMWFWAWGDSEAEVMDNLDRVFANLARALSLATGPSGEPT